VSDRPADAPTALRTEFEDAPANVAPGRPRLSWRGTVDCRGATQRAYRVRVARARDDLAVDECLWDSGWVESDASGVAYDGPALEADAAYRWQVRVRDDRGASPWSEPAAFGTGLAGESEWAGEWISHQPEGGDANGYRSEWRADEDATAWVQVDLGESRALTKVGLHPAAPFDGPETPDGVTVSPLYAHGDAGLEAEGATGFGFPVRYRIEVSDDPDFGDATTVVDRTDEAQPNPAADSVRVEAEANGRYVRVTATECAEFDPGDAPEGGAQLKTDLMRERVQSWRVFALAGLTVEGADGEDLADGRPVEAASSVEDETWGRDALVDGHPASRRAASAPRVREEFDLPESVAIASARAHVATPGYGELYLNGERIGDRVLDPAWTDYGERVLYATHDVTDALRAGENAVGVWLGRGRYGKSTRDWVGGGSPRVRLHLTVEFEDGTTRTLGTGTDWAAASSPVLENDLYDGEVYDARAEEPGWADPGFEGDWDAAAAVAGPDGDLCPERIQPMEVVETFEPEELLDHEDGPIVDFGQNLTGWVELDVEGASEGDEIVLRHTEALTEGGELSTVDLRSADATDRYVARGDERESYEPRFTYHGFRYVQVSGAADAVDPSAVTAKAVHTAMDRRGAFDCSDPDLRQVQHNAVWGLRGNTHSIPEDCPQRDERFGWTGDGHITSRALLYNFDAARFQEKWTRDHDDVQSRHGYVWDTVPRGFGTHPGDPCWTITRVVVPWHLYQHHGDRRVLREHYEPMRRYVDFWDSLVEDGVLPAEYGNYGDWVAFENTDGRRGLPHDLFNSAYHYRTVDLLARIADVLENEADAERYRDRATELAAGFNDAYLDGDGVYGPGTQSAYAVPLFFGMVPEDRVEEVVANLVEKVEGDGRQLRTGFLGTRPLLFALAEYGRPDLAYEIVSQPERPGWVYMAEQGATTMWEHWDSDEQVGSGMNSLNHSPNTFVSEWFFEVLAGLRLRGDTPPDHVEIAPVPVADLDWAEGTLDTDDGELAARWERTERGLELDVTVPWNRTATVRVPAAPDATVRESGTDLGGSEGERPDGIEAVERDGDRVVAEVGAGDYAFAVDESPEV
jgi:alpha-L-rhamnosidase